MVLLWRLLWILGELQCHPGVPAMLTRLLPTLLLTFGLWCAASSVSSADPAIDAIRDSGTVRIGYRVDTAPFSYERNGQPAGYSIAVCANIVETLSQALGRDLTITFVRVSTMSDDRFEAITSRRIDLLCEASTITLERRERVDFSSIIHVTGAGVLFWQDDVSGFEDLGSKPVGVLTQTTTEQAVADYLDASGIDASLVRFESHDKGFAALEAREISAYFADRDLLAAHILNRGGADGGLSLSNRYFTIEPYGIALPRNSPDLRLLIDRALAEMYRSGRIRQIMVEYLSQEPTDLHETVFALFAYPMR